MQPIGSLSKNTNLTETLKVFGSLFGKKISAAPSATVSESTEPAVEPVSQPNSPAKPEERNSQVHTAGPAEGNTTALDGLSIEEYAALQNLSNDEVWSRLRKGQLVGRTSRGKVLVYESISAAALAAPAPGHDGPSGGDLPPLEFGATSAGSMVALETVGGSSSTELALMLDHLSLAKEENREILRLTQDTLTKLSSMTDAVVQMKDEIIKSKDQQLASLQSAVAENEKNIAKLRQEKEDLEILNRTLGQALDGDASHKRG